MEHPNICIFSTVDFRFWMKILVNVNDEICDDDDHVVNVVVYDLVHENVNDRDDDAIYDRENEPLVNADYYDLNMSL